jgi:hypothetical protein
MRFRALMRSLAAAQGGNSLLTVQIDAAINPGNSGGPAFNDIQVRLASRVCAHRRFALARWALTRQRCSAAWWWASPSPSCATATTSGALTGR